MLSVLRQPNPPEVQLAENGIKALGEVLQARHYWPAQ
jgi:hypothetical protein